MASVTTVDSDPYNTEKPLRHLLSDRNESPDAVLNRFDGDVVRMKGTNWCSVMSGVTRANSDPYNTEKHVGHLLSPDDKAPDAVLNHYLQSEGQFTLVTEPIIIVVHLVHTVYGVKIAQTI